MWGWSCDSDTNWQGTESHSNKAQGTLKSSWWLFSAQFRGFGLCAKERHYRPGWRHLLGRWRFWQMEILAGMALGWQGSCSNESWEQRWIMCDRIRSWPDFGEDSGFPLRIVSFSSCMPCALKTMRHTRPRKMLKMSPFPQRGLRN